MFSVAPLLQVQKKYYDLLHHTTIKQGFFIQENQVLV